MRPYNLQVQVIILECHSFITVLLRLNFIQVESTQNQVGCGLKCNITLSRQSTVMEANVFLHHRNTVSVIADHYDWRILHVDYTIAVPRAWVH